MVTDSKTQNILGPLKLSDGQLREAMKLLLEEMKKGLGKDTNPTATIKMLPTYVRAVPKGAEQGKFLALDLGGTNFRVLLIDLHGKHVKMSSKIFNVPQEVMTGTGEGLFDHIAECMYRFMSAEGIVEQVLPLGFTFSFPCRQLGLDKAVLIKWTKGFKASGVEGQDVAQLLREAVKRHGGFGVDIVAVVNDTTGTMMSCAHSTPSCYMGLIIGTGCNACYMERLENVELWDGDNNDPKEVIINMEWGAFGDNGCLEFVRTDIDRALDAQSINPGNQLYEKMMSGMYLGELVRLVLVKLCENGVLFGGKLPNILKKKDAFYTKYVSEIEGEREEHYTKCMKIIRDELGIPNASQEDLKLVRDACAAISSRAAYLAGIGCATVINHMQREKCTVGIDGSVYKYHPKFHNLMVECMKQYVDKRIEADVARPRKFGPNELYNFNLMLSEDGSGKGAALIAAVASHLSS